MAPQRPTAWLGVVGLELRCAERIFISLNSRQCSDLPAPAQTVLSFQENSFLFQGCPRAPLPTHAVRRAGLNTSEFESDMGGISHSNSDVQRGFPQLWAALFAPRFARSRSDRVRLKWAHFPLDFPCEWSVSGAYGRPDPWSGKLLSPASAVVPPRGCGGASRWCAATQRGAKTVVAPRPAPIAKAGFSTGDRLHA
jgi:hypothetical protein